MSTSALITMMVIQLLVSVITFYFIFEVLRRNRPNNPSDTQEQF